MSDVSTFEALAHANAVAMSWLIARLDHAGALDGPSFVELLRSVDGDDPLALPLAAIGNTAARFMDEAAAPSPARPALRLVD